MFIDGLRQFASDPRIPKNACDCTHACPEDRLGYMQTDLSSDRDRFFTYFAQGRCSRRVARVKDHSNGGNTIEDHFLVVHCSLYRDGCPVVAFQLAVLTAGFE